MKRLIYLSLLLTGLAQAHPELCLPDHEKEYVGGYAEMKTGLDKFWNDLHLTCADVGEFLDQLELKDPPPLTSTEKEKCAWTGKALGYGLFSHQRRDQCGIGKCVRQGNYVGRNVARAFCGSAGLYTSDRFLAEIEVPVCRIADPQACRNEAEILAGAHCPQMKVTHAALWQRLLQQTCSSR